MRKILGAAGIATAVGVTLALAYARYHNELVALEVAAESQWKQVENQIARQNELLPKLALIVKRYVVHERDVLQALFDSRERYMRASEMTRPEVAAEMDGLLVHALALGERYPQLQADQQYRDLAYEIAGTKNRIAVERKRYNDAVAQLNTRLRQFPWALAAGDVRPRSFYEAEEELLAEPRLEL